MNTLTDAQIAELLHNTEYSALFFFVIVGLLILCLFLYDEGVTNVYIGRADLGWLQILLVPLNLCVIIAYFIVVMPYLFWRQ